MSEGCKKKVKKKSKTPHNQRGAENRVELTEIMLIIEEYFRTGVVVYLWSKYLWQQMLERRQRNVLDTYKVAPAEIREIIDDETYKSYRNAALRRSGFEVFKTTLNIGLSTTFLCFEGYRKLWDRTSEIVAYFNFEDSKEIVKNALFLTIMSSGTFLASLPFAMLEICVRQSEDAEQSFDLLNVLLGHSIAQTLLFPFVCLFVLGFRLGGENTLLWAFGFAEFQLLTDSMNTDGAHPLPPGVLRSELETLAEKCKFPLQDVLVAKRLNGPKQVRLRGFPRARTIVLDEQLTHGGSSNEEQNITVEDVSALVARQISCWSCGHPYIRFAVNQIHLCLHLYTMHQLLNSQTLYEAFGFNDKPLAVGLALLQYCPLFDLYNFSARMINRQLEFAVDEDVKRMHGDASLKKAIVKISSHAKSFPVQDPLYSACYNSQASAYERITVLNEANHL